MSDFKKGDQVQLKSGGPIMTVSYVDDVQPPLEDRLYPEQEFNVTIFCQWFDQKNNLQSASFNPETLIKK
ncbi:YodC family protein [Pseudomonas sp. Irchel s3f10]|uniref:YodC family protein n=1 Tax=Pseudomonas sp. Irchel s3f10 TaxID=2009137 RepID=UPI000BA494D4|nr:DUF2158 domain-containing protein [Pseudomonas sp. Irchel s3f10]